MNVYIWLSEDGVTDSYHSGAGIVIFAESEDAAREAFKANRENFNKAERLDRENEVKTGLVSKPDYAESTESMCGKVFIFPDQGCC